MGHCFAKNPRAGTLALLVLCVGCENEQPAKVNKSPRVIVTRPISAVVLDYQDFTGRLDAVKTVDIRARVSGYVTKAPGKEKGVVQEGELVRGPSVGKDGKLQEGDLLFQIDVRPYEADLNQAEANLKVALADRDLQKKNAERAKNLLPAKAISFEEYETTLATLEKSIATVGSMEAMRDRAKLYVDYTRVTAPVSGRVSRRYIDPGNLVNADATVLTTIVTENPMYAYFDVDERTYLNLLAMTGADKTSWHEGLNIPVMMRLANETEFERVGKIDFVDNRVVATSGTVRMRGVFDNAGGLLKAGLFVRIRLPIGLPYTATVIPDEAILSDQERKYVWVVNTQNEVEYRSVELGQSIRELRALRAPEPGKQDKVGLKPDDRIVVSGMQRVRKGTVVDAQLQAPAPPDLALVRLFKRNAAR